MDRSNLCYSVIGKPTGESNVALALWELISTRFLGQSGIVYCGSRRVCETLSLALNELALSHGRDHMCFSFYHAQLSAQDKEAVYLAWRSGRVNVIFGQLAWSCIVKYAANSKTHSLASTHVLCHCSLGMQVHMRTCVDGSTRYPDRTLTTQSTSQ
jgi:hypothetical protein